MITFVIVLLALIAVLLGAAYGLYRLVFLHPLKKRPDMHQIPESDLYKAYRDIMLDAVSEMESASYEDVSIESSDGYRLCGKLYNIKNDAPLVIFFHGYHGVFAWE